MLTRFGTLRRLAPSSLFAAVAALAVATTLITTPVEHPVRANGVLTNDGAGADCTDNYDPRCQAVDEEEYEVPDDDPHRDRGNGGGGSSGCYWDAGSDVIQAVDDAQDEVQLILTAANNRIEIPCVHPEWGFLSDGCYWGDPPAIAQFESQAPDGMVEGEDGNTLWATACIASVSGEMPNQDITIYAVLAWRWFPFSETTAAIDPETVARHWLAGVDLAAVQFELAPPETGAGLIGLPVWLGVGDAEASWGPRGAEHCLQGVCVTISAEVTEVSWDMADGTVFTCARAQHRTWDSSQDFRAPGDNCHHYYERASRGQPGGKYEITATSHWAVTWEAQASDANGTLSAEATGSVALQIDEIQVLTRN